ncbi:hypothetical protein AVCANL279_01655 [Campylobacter canadensis]|uniref:urease accessory protein UreF n=1 Tax=Campylobacter canadensis TaxID=449520 RepID=UPI001CCD1869|nr:urease accessory UreF family protein [Campylobacter canadensis]MBZ7996036.1 hypothetical protein [Campylobacter canadensis]MBZ7999672.1 hypothetical protein [Campylobacter canadensis]MBZ8001467.1 hypothetical protein [Campylobacter canadensis]MBZ8003959.1 hypothetical protein [Campylobacter canadensis]
MLGQFLFDSTFANGAYSHSFGLESYIFWGKIKNEQSYQVWLESYMLDVFAPADAAVYILACKLKEKRLSLLKLARIANASIASFESRTGAINMARATLKNTEFMHNDLAKWYFKICDNDNYTHPAIAFSVLADDKVESYAYACIKTLTQNATRAIPLSYRKSSELLYKNIDLAKKCALKAKQIADNSLKNNSFSLNNCDYRLFSTHHELDIAMFAHEKLDFRLFMS